VTLQTRPYTKFSTRRDGRKKYSKQNPAREKPRKNHKASQEKKSKQIEKKTRAQSEFGNFKILASAAERS